MHYLSDLKISASFSYQADTDNRKNGHLSADTDMVADISCIPSVNATEFVFETVWHMIVTVCWVSVDESHWNKQTELREKLLSSFSLCSNTYIRSVSPAELQQTQTC